MLRLFASFLSLLLIFSFTASPALAAKDGFSKGKTVKQLQKEYDDGKIRILIAAGHEPGYGGAVYQGVYEREIVVEVADELRRLLANNPNYEVIVTRSDSKWNSSLQKYFTKNKKKIQSFVKAQKKKMAKLLKKEKLNDNADSHGAPAPEDVALRLYGINKWANENNIDLVVNLHVNDAPDHGPNEPSRHSGYAVFVPDKIYGNNRTSKELGRKIAKRLDALSNESTHPLEAAGVVEHRDFIAVGAAGTLNVPSVLVEYGYITEPRFALVEHRETLTEDLAYQTYLALQDFFGDPVMNPRKVAKLPTKWPEPPPMAPTVAGVSTTTAPTPVTIASPAPAPAVPAVACLAFNATLVPNPDAEVPSDEVRRLQTLLAMDKAIYPEGLTTGFFGPATQKAVERFQIKHSIVMSGTPETTGFGAVGPRTGKTLLAAAQCG